MTTNADLFARAQAAIPGGVNSPVRAFRSVGGTPRFLVSARGIRHRLDDARVGVAEDRGTPAGDEVDVLASLGVGHVRAARRHEEARRAAHGAERAHGRVHATRDRGLRAGEQVGVGGAPR